MPLNANNSRQEWRTAYAGITEYATLVRRNSNGTITSESVRETWVSFFLPAEETTEGGGESDFVAVKRNIKLFMRYNETKRKPPKIGDQIRRKDGTDWEVLPQLIQRQLFGSNCFDLATVQRIPESS